MNGDVIFRYKNGRIIPIKVNKEQTTNEYMNDKIRNINDKVKETYTIKKQQDRQFKNFRTMELYIGKEKAGYLEYQNNNGNITVNVIKTEPRFERKGVATRLLKELKDENGDIIYKFSAVLSDGDKLLKSKTNIIKKDFGDYYVKIK